MIKIFWITNIPSPYKVELFNMLANYFDVTVFFENKTEKGREDAWYNYNFKNFKAIYADNNYRMIINKYASESDILINADYSNKICIYATYKFKKNKKPVILQADGGIALDRGWLFNNLISLIMKQCDYFLSSGKEVDKYFKFYNVDDKKIFNYRFSSLNNKDIVRNEELTLQKYYLREKYGIKDDIMILAVGSQIFRKGYDLLIKAISSINKSFNLYIVGGVVQDDIFKLVLENGLNNVHFIDFKCKEELNEYYAMADIFVMPTRYDIWGLVINEAMSFKLPIISSNKCVAALEFNNLFNNALIFESENVEDLKEKIEILISDCEIREKLSINSLNGIKTYTIENTCDDFVKIINKILKEENRCYQ